MLAAVREKVTPIQRRLAAAGGAVLEGRDTGSVVCPDAEVQFYLDASPDVRVVRRQRELEARGLPARHGCCPRSWGLSRSWWPVSCSGSRCGGRSTSLRPARR